MERSFIYLCFDMVKSFSGYFRSVFLPISVNLRAIVGEDNEFINGILDSVGDFPILGDLFNMSLFEFCIGALFIVLLFNFIRWIISFIP